MSAIDAIDATMLQVIARAPGLKPYSFFVHAGADRFISDRIRRTGCWEPFESRVILGLLGGGDQMIDIGANIGWYTVGAAHRVGEWGHIFAFEPDETNYALLSANVRGCQLDCITFEQVALGRAGGRASICRSPDNQGDHRVRSFVEEGVAHGAEPRGAVVVQSLDDYLRTAISFDVKRLRVIKLDVQGFEYEVLSGASGLLASLPERTVLFVEFDSVLLHETSPTAAAGLIELLCALDREMYAIARPIWRLVRQSAASLRRCAQEGMGASLDLILAHRSIISELRAALPPVPRVLSHHSLR